MNKKALISSKNQIVDKGKGGHGWAKTFGKISSMTLKMTTNSSTIIPQVPKPYNDSKTPYGTYKTKTCGRNCKCSPNLVTIPEKGNNINKTTMNKTMLIVTS
jgi:hypothetical protein